MTRLPHGDRAILDLQKLEAYCLSPVHPRGRHKARVFREALGVARGDAPWLREALLAAARDHEAFELVTDRFGSRWRVDSTISRQDKHAVVRSLWIVRSSEDFPRFVTCWVL